MAELGGKGELAEEDGGQVEGGKQAEGGMVDDEAQQQNKDGQWKDSPSSQFQARTRRRPIRPAL